MPAQARLPNEANSPAQHDELRKSNLCRLSSIDTPVRFSYPLALLIV